MRYLLCLTLLFNLVFADIVNNGKYSFSGDQIVVYFDVHIEDKQKINIVKDSPDNFSLTMYDDYGNIVLSLPAEKGYPKGKSFEVEPGGYIIEIYLSGKPGHFSFFCPCFHEWSKRLPPMFDPRRPK